jgi:heat shock protein HslJ
MPVLRYGVVMLALLAMVWPSAPPVALSGLAGSAWNLIEVGGAQAKGAGTVRFTQTSIRGRSACNSFSGAFRENQGRIEIAGIIPASEVGEVSNRTPAACKTHLSLERYFLESLSRAATYKIDGGNLMILDESGRALARLSD